MRLLTTTLVILSFALSTQAQDHHAPSGHGTANYDLAARWAPYRIDDLLHSTSVSPRWMDPARLMVCN